MTYKDAVWKTIAEEMRRDPSIFYYCEYRAPKALVDEFGWGRVNYAGIQETQMAGAGIGAALAGTRPIVYLHSADFALDCWGQLTDQAGMIRFKVAYKLDCPVVFWSGCAGGFRGTVHHSGYYVNWMANTPGIMVAIPSMAADAVGLWRTQLRQGRDPVYMFDARVTGIEGSVPDDDYTIPFGVADIKRKGSDVTIAAVGYWVHTALEAAEELAQQGIDAEVWDPRTLQPFDRESLVKSVKRTGGMVVVDQAPKIFGSTGEFFATVGEALTPIPPMARVATMNVPRGAASTLCGDYIYPTKEKIISAVKEVLRRKG